MKTTIVIVAFHEPVANIAAQVYRQCLGQHYTVLVVDPQFSHFELFSECEALVIDHRLASWLMRPEMQLGKLWARIVPFDEADYSGIHDHIRACHAKIGKPDAFSVINPVLATTSNKNYVAAF